VVTAVITVEQRDFVGGKPLFYSVGIGDSFFGNVFWSAGIHDFQIVASELVDFVAIGIEIRVGFTRHFLDRGSVGLGEGSIGQQEYPISVFDSDESGDTIDNRPQEASFAFQSLLG